jgi:hypothetical protein
MNLHTNYHVESSEFMSDYVSVMRERGNCHTRTPLTPTPHTPVDYESTEQHYAASSSNKNNNTTNKQNNQVLEDEQLARELQQELNLQMSHAEHHYHMYSPDVDHEHVRTPNQIIDEEENDENAHVERYNSKPLVHKRSKSLLKKMVEFLVFE